jgi:hypothetical protein
MEESDRLRKIWLDFSQARIRKILEL